MIDYKIIQIAKYDYDFKNYYQFLASLFKILNFIEYIFNIFIL